MRSGFVAVLVLGCALPPSHQSTGSNVATISMGPCITGGSTKGTVEIYRFADTTTGPDMITWRQSLSLQRVPVDQIALVVNPAVCSRALSAFNSLFGKNASFQPVDSVYVVRYGATRLIVGNPSGPHGGEWRYEPIFDTSYTKVAIAGR